MSGLLAQLRGRDGRSFARALAVLLLVNTLVTGLSSGAMADTGSAPFLCLSGTEYAPADPGSTAAVNHDCVLCCLSRGMDGIAAASVPEAAGRHLPATAAPRLAAYTDAGAFLAHVGSHPRAPPGNS